MTIRTVKGTVDTFFVNAGSEITYLGNTQYDSSTSLAYRAFRINPTTTGDIIVKIVASSGVKDVQIFQEDDYNAGTAPAGYTKFSDIAKNGKDKGVVAVTVTNAAKDYVVLLDLDISSSVSYVCEVDVP